MKYSTTISLTNTIQNKARKLCYLCVLGIILLSNSVFSQLTITISSVPDNTLQTDSIYLASSLSNWNPKDSNYLFQKGSAKAYELTFNPPIGKFEFKFTKGSWSTVETDIEGNDVPNKVIIYDGSSALVNFTIKGWKEEEETISTAAENVSIMKENFYLPNLKRERKVWIYLPPDYNTTQKHYPVLYMHDGQNLFDKKNSFAGEWNVDESLNNLFEENGEGVIVIGIENGGAKRLEEYTPWSNEKFGGGRGDEYVEFIVSTLKPYVDNNYRTKSDRLNTGIMGSSLGGLISFYAAIKYQDVFSKAGVFSPSFWFTKEVFDFAEKTGKHQDMKFYLLGGELEGEFLKKDMEKMISILHKVGFTSSETKMVSKSDGDHNEAFWSREFSDGFQWLFR